MAITSEATTMSNPSWRGNPLPGPPSPTVISRNARSFMSMTRFHAIRRTSNAELVAVVHVVVDQRGQEIVRERRWRRNRR